MRFLFLNQWIAKGVFGGLTLFAHTKYRTRFQYLFLMFAMGTSTDVLSQSSPFSTLQNAVPPSPEAISFAQQTFSNVNLYTGKVDYSIPIYTLSQNGMDFPITLSYTGGNGIKVEEVASSVGLGWSLQYTGVITRSMKGGADDRFSGDYRGYIHLPGIDTTYHDVSKTDHHLYENGYNSGRYDPQPDLYFISAPGLSASFYINKLKEIVFVEKSDLQVKILFSGYTITGFEVRDLSGNTFVFDVTETTKSIPLEGSYEYNLYDVSSWYLSKIINSHGIAIFSFDYQSKELNQTTQLLRAPYQFTLNNPLLSPFDEDNSTYSLLHTKRLLLSKIHTSIGEVIFIMSENSRCDLGNDRSIDSIIVRDSNSKIVRQFNFDYSYFSETGTIQENEATPTYEGNPSLRLKLDRLEVLGGDEAVQKEIYSFVYDTTKLLPNRLSSFSMDHWGFYNGVANTTWEARHRAKYYIPGLFFNDPKLQLKEFGTANREPNAEFAKACMLKEVITPTGGSFQFEYEGHTSSDQRLPNTLSTTIIEYTLDEGKNYFSIDLINEPFAFLKVQAFAENGVQIQYTLSDSLESIIPIIDTLKEGSIQHTHILPPGPYYIKAKIIIPHPDISFNYGPRLIKDTETLVLNKPVGGLRIKKMTLIDPNTGNNLTRNYYYNKAGANDPQSESTGTIGNIPVYGYQSVFVNHETPRVLFQGYVRQLSTTYPLIGTNGSYTGYDKVTVIDNDTHKSEYSFTSFNTFPECVDGYLGDALLSALLGNPDPLNPILPFDPNNSKVIVNGELLEHWPFAPSDERDHYRGKLEMEISYRKDGDSFVKIAELKNLYQHNFGFVGTKPGPSGFPERHEYLVGMVSTGERNRSKSYVLHTGRIDLYRTIETNYVTGATIDSVAVETIFDYGQTAWYRDELLHYQVTKIIKSTSSSIVDTTRYLYPYDWRYGQPDITIADTAYFRKLEKQNRIGLPIIQKNFSEGMHTTTTKNIYSTFGNVVNPSVVQIKNGAETAFEDRIYYTAYDTLGNIIEQQKTFDSKSVYLWDYNLSYPVAQVTNATLTQVAYTSFEADGKGNWLFTGTPEMDSTAPTGEKVLAFNGSITKTGLQTATTYKVSYWKKGGSVSVNSTSGQAGETNSGWTYYEHIIANPVGGTITVSGSGGDIDELRLYPMDAQMTTYAYKPLVGITESCDQNNTIFRYDYDGLGRLKVVKDAKGNVLKQHQYHLVQTGSN